MKDYVLAFGSIVIVCLMLIVVSLALLIASPFIAFYSNGRFEEMFNKSWPDGGEA